MPIHMPHMNLLASVMWPDTWYTDSDDEANADANDSNTA